MEFHWQRHFMTSIEDLETKTRSTSVVNLYGLPWGKTTVSTLYKNHPSISFVHCECCSEQELESAIEHVSNKIVVVISIDILPYSCIDYYFNVEENLLLPRIASS